MVPQGFPPGDLFGPSGLPIINNSNRDNDLPLLIISILQINDFLCWWLPGSWDGYQYFLLILPSPWKRRRQWSGCHHHHYRPHLTIQLLPIPEDPPYCERTWSLRHPPPSIPTLRETTTATATVIIMLTSVSLTNQTTRKKSCARLSGFKQFPKLLSLFLSGGYVTAPSLLASGGFGIIELVCWGFKGI